MSWSLLLGEILCLVMVGISLWLRMANIQRRQWMAHDLPQQPLSSVFSKALEQLLGIAGGIYLTLLATVSFLQIDFPDKMHVFGLAVEPLAFVAVILALIQPFFERQRLKRG